MGCYLVLIRPDDQRRDRQRARFLFADAAGWRPAHTRSAWFGEHATFESTSARYGVHNGPGQTAYARPPFAAQATVRVCAQLHDPSLQRAVALTPSVPVGGVG